MFWQIFIIALLVATLVLSIILALNFSSLLSKPQTDKMKPIECGFEDQLKGSRSPFSMYFFSLAVLFLVFDVETVLLFPAPLALNFFQDPTLAMGIFSFLIILLLGLIHETRQGALKWA